MKSSDLTPEFPISAALMPFNPLRHSSRSACQGTASPNVRKTQQYGISHMDQSQFPPQPAGKLAGRLRASRFTELLPQAGQARSSRAIGHME